MLASFSNSLSPSAHSPLHTQEKRIEAAAAGYKKENFHIKTEIKAATYHELKIEKTKSGWQAQIIFDV